MAKVIKKFHHYEKWEDYQAGMYENMQGRDRRIMLNKAISFTSNANLYGKWMLKVINEWPICCEQNLSDKCINQQAWIGHAATCMAIQCPEDITRQAWGCLSQLQKEQANNQANLAIKAWNEKQNNKIHTKMGKTRI